MTTKHLIVYTFSILLGLHSHSPAQDITKAQALEKIFTLRETTAFHQAMKEAKKAEVHPQALLEARFLFLVDTGSTSQLAALSPEMQQHRELFSLENSQIFSVKEDWLAVVHYTQALAALEQSDRTAFRAHITEAFWLSPRQGSAFAPHIEQLHLDDAMTKVHITPEHPFLYHTKEGKTTFTELTKDKKALLVHFWSPWSRESEETFLDFVATAQECENHDIAVLAVLADPSNEVMLDAKGFLEHHSDQTGFQWIIDDIDNPLSRTMRLQQFPNFVLISKAGDILFNGNPNNEQLWIELTDLAPKLQRPDSIKNKKNTNPTSTPNND